MVDFFKRNSIYCSDPTAYRNIRDVICLLSDISCQNIVFVGTYTYTSKQLMGC